MFLVKLWVKLAGLEDKKFIRLLTIQSQRWWDYIKSYIFCVGSYNGQSAFLFNILMIYFSTLLCKIVNLDCFYIFAWLKHMKIHLEIIKFCWNSISKIFWLHCDFMKMGFWSLSLQVNRLSNTLWCDVMK